MVFPQILGPKKRALRLNVCPRMSGVKVYILVIEYLCDIVELYCVYNLYYD